MKIYIDYGENIRFENLWFAKTSGCVPYQEFLKELESGEAQLIPYTLPLPTWEQIISKRDQLLRESDYKVLPDANPETKDLWIAYREVLRNITETFNTPESVIWPISPKI